MKLTTRQKRHLFNAAMFLLFLLVASEPVFASTSSSGSSNPFSTIVQLLIGWLQGGLGLMLALLALTVGLVAGVGRGSIAGALSGIAVAIAAYWGPNILQSIFGAVAASAHFATVAYF